MACNRYVVGRVTAVDADPGDNGVVRYSVDDSDEAAAGFLTVDAEDGTLTLARPLDRESRRRVDVPLRARDLGVGGQWLEARRVFTVLVADVNDHPPRFTRAAYSVSVHQVVSYYLFYIKLKPQWPEKLHTQRQYHTSLTRVQCSSPFHWS